MSDPMGILSHFDNHSIYVYDLKKKTSSSQHSERTIPVIIIGILVFLPGFYHLRIAYYAYKGFRGYSYDDIPDFGD